MKARDAQGMKPSQGRNPSSKVGHPQQPRWSVLLLVTLLCGPALSSSSSWHVPDAVLKFTIAADPNRMQVPNVDIHGKETRDGSWSGGYYRIDGKLYKDAIAMRCPEEATYRYVDGARRFVALVGVRQNAGDAASIVFEVFADTRKLYSSPSMTKYQPPIGIDVRVPPRTKRIRLVTRGSDSQGHHWAGWVNAGFWTRLDDPRVGYVTLPVPGFDPSQYEAAVFTSDGKRVAGTRLAALQDGKVDQLFFAGHGWPTYYVYWVPKDKYKSATQNWQPNAGLVLETRKVAKSRGKSCENLAGLMKVWDEANHVVGRGFVSGIHHAYPIQPDLMTDDDAAAKDELALYRYTGFFKTDEPGKYLFATASHWGSYLLVDDKPIVSWPGNHGYRDGVRGQKQGEVTLQSGIHKLEYLNYNLSDRMFTLAAWQPPRGKLSVMTESDFPCVRGYAVTGVEYDSATRAQVSFDWNVVDDWRLDRDQSAMIRMRFQAIPDLAVESAKGPQNSSSRGYRWVFDDGVTRTGQVVERVFFGPSQHRVTVQKLVGSQVVAETTRPVYAGTLSEKIWVDPRDPNVFRHEISKIDLRQAPVEDVVRLYTFGQDLSESAWEDATTQALLQRVDELMARAEYQPLCLQLSQYLASAPVQDYDQAVTLCTRLQERTHADSPIRQHTMVLAGELLLRCLGRPDAALRILNQARWEPTRDKTWTIRLGLARAEALLALGQMDELDEQMQQLCEDRNPQDLRREEIRRAGLLHRAQGLARDAKDGETNDDLTSLNMAMDNLQTVLYEDPAQLLLPGLNLIRLDVLLARREYGIAHHLAERLLKLDLSPYDRAQVLLRHMNALCGMGSLDRARGILQELTQAYPGSEEVSRAKATLIQAVIDRRPR